LEPVAGLTPPSQPVTPAEPLLASEDWEEILRERRRGPLEACLSAWVQKQSWFGGKNRELKSVQIRDTIRFPADSNTVSLLFLLVEYVEGDPEEYFMPLGFAVGKEREKLEQEAPLSIVNPLRLESQNVEGVLYD